MLFLSLYCVSEFGLLLQYRFWYKPPIAPSQFRDIPSEKLPKVLIQLPLYNEPFVVERLLQSILKIKYPQHLVTIQILDDSTDETSDIIMSNVPRLSAGGETQGNGYGKPLDIIRRAERTGFKAGALAFGLAQSDADLVAIFDADFVPDADFLEKTVPHFYKNDRLALVQTRWAHLNRNHSILTQVQAMQLDVHFTVEQGGRAGSGSFMQFNGTAGVWRAAAIHDAGGWQADTLTEDLDLSYRAQLRGWQMLYDESTTAPAELPVDIESLISQQFRWTKGGAECARKLLPMVLKADLPIRTKLNAITHLLSSLVFVAMIMAMIGSLLLPLIGNIIALPMQFWRLGFVPTALLFFVHFVTNFKIQNNIYSVKDVSIFSLIKNLLLFPFHYCLLLSLSMGIGFYNVKAVWEGWTGRKSPFIRTPKRGNSNNITAKENDYSFYKILQINRLEAFFCLLLSVYSITEIINGYYIVSFIHGLWSWGFGMILWYFYKK
jgi:cellulose synthase/poly-beta-1,6-N-acetylglucosamine synthase-like glycosyltransferase